MPNQITPSNLLRLIGLHDCPTLIDIHLPKDVQRDPRLIPGSVFLPHTHWVTRHRPRFDHIACRWLIRRYIDTTARLLYLVPSEVLAVAERFNATPFDMKGIPFRHRGDMCTFDTMLAEWGPQTEALQRLARVIRTADTDRHHLSPQAAGLLALPVGLSRQYRDDPDQLAAGLTLYAALYRWDCDGQDETHNWPTGRI